MIFVIIHFRQELILQNRFLIHQLYLRMVLLRRLHLPEDYLHQDS